VFLSLLWFAAVLFKTVTDLNSDTPQLVAVDTSTGETTYFYPKLRTIRDGLILWIAPSLAVFLLARGIVWVWRGFAESHS